jgi:hypothetical protein
MTATSAHEPYTPTILIVDDGPANLDVVAEGDPLVREPYGQHPSANSTRYAAKTGLAGQPVQRKGLFRS